MLLVQQGRSAPISVLAFDVEAGRMSPSGSGLFGGRLRIVPARPLQVVGLEYRQEMGGLPERHTCWFSSIERLTKNTMVSDICAPNGAFFGLRRKQDGFISRHALQAVLTRPRG